ncbi:MAG TPA: hypothetical protein VHE30_06325 [Polyangiaceae bacterium]|nr:hypothetical protein [Polyangiaceae bacterium]
MKRTRALARVGFIALLCTSVPVTVACGGGGKEAHHPLPKAGDMPEGGEWTGVYFSTTYGYLHLVKEGATVSGRWRNAAGDKWGEMSGEATGNLFLFDWKENKIGMVGPSASTTGRGYFVYTRPPGENVNDEIKGEWGLGSERTGVSWTAVKQRNMKPDPASVMPDETQKLEGGGWDESKKKSGGDSDSKDDGWN